MKKLLLLAALLLCVAVSYSQNKDNFKFGKATDEEVKMTQYPLDNAASAVILYESGINYISYDYRKGFIRSFEVVRRLKIFKDEGKNYADVSISYRMTPGGDEFISNLEAYSYNAENGKVIKTKIGRDNITTEKVSNTLFRQKFSIPNVKRGSVIEYKYTVNSDFFWEVPDWYFQGSIPVKESYFEVDIPEYFKFRKNMQGSYPIDAQTRQNAKSVSLGGGDALTYQENAYTFRALNLPAMREEPLVWCPEQYYSAVFFEMTTLSIPGETIKDLSNTWPTVDNNLKDDDEFGPYVKMNTPYKDYVDSLKTKSLDEYTKMRDICMHIKRDVAFNKNVSIYSKGPKDAARKKTGNSADINFLVKSALDYAGFTTDIILVKSLIEGELNILRASADELSSFILRIHLSDGKYAYFDASSKYGDINIISPDLMVKTGRIYKDPSQQWIDLTEISSGSARFSANINVDSEGNAKGTYIRSMNNQLATSFQNKYHSYNSESEYINYLSKDLKLNVKKLTVEPKDTISTRAVAMIDFEKQFDTAGDIIYINPFIETFLDETTFNSPERKFPIEFPYPYKFTYITTVTIPDGYTIDDCPKSIKFLFSESALEAAFYFQVQENKIIVKHTFNLGNSAIQATNYEKLRDFWQKTCAMYKSVIVIKKK